MKNPHVVVAYNAEAKLLQLETGSVIVQDDMEHFIADGCTFVTQDADGNQAALTVVHMQEDQHLRTAHNDIVSDNLKNLPTF
jgi:hypothetical protein